MKKDLLILGLLLPALLLGCGKEKTPETSVPPSTEYRPVDMVFLPREETVTAKDTVNLRDYPTQDEESHVMAVLKNGEEAIRVGVSDSGWSRIEYQGGLYYAVSNFLTTNLSYVPTTAADNDGDGVVTEFAALSEVVTAKDVVNLRTLPGVDNPDSQIVAQFRNGDTAQRIGISGNGWSKLLYNGETVYAVSSYLTTDLNYQVKGELLPSDEGIQTRFNEANEYVTAKIEVNLRDKPSVTEGESQVVAKLKNGDVAKRVGINADLGWSKVEYNGQTLYCVSSYLKTCPPPAETEGGNS